MEKWRENGKTEKEGRVERLEKKYCEIEQMGEGWKGQEYVMAKVLDSEWYQIAPIVEQTSTLAR